MLRVNRAGSFEEFREALGQATGMTASAELAKMFAVEESEVITSPPQPTILETLVEPSARARAPQADAIVLRKQDLVRVASIAAVLAVGVVMLAYAALRRPPAAVPVMTAAAAPAPAPTEPEERRPPPREEREPESEPTASEPVDPDPPPSRRRRAFEAPLTFETKTIVSSKGNNKERSAFLRLADGQITVTADDETRALLYTVPYERVIAINYSRSRHPMWNSPQGPAPVVRTGGTLSRFGISFDRHWISLRTHTSHQFVNLRFDDVVAPKVLVALEERTGRRHQVIEEEKDDDKGRSEK